MRRRARSGVGPGAGLVTAMIACSFAWVSLGHAQDRPASVPLSVQQSEGAATQTLSATSLDMSQSPPTAATSPLDGLRISLQSWRRGGLGSKALVTFKLRNANDYAVKDIEIACAFMRRDGSHLTDRKRMISETVKMKSSRTFTRVHVGFVNVNAEKAKCTLVAASRL